MSYPMSNQIPLTPELEEKIVRLAKAQKSLDIASDIILELHDCEEITGEVFDKIYEGINEADAIIRRHFDDIGARVIDESS